MIVYHLQRVSTDNSNIALEPRMNLRGKFLSILPVPDEIRGRNHHGIENVEYSVRDLDRF